MKTENYVDSCKNFLTLYIVTRAVGDEEIIIIGQVGPGRMVKKAQRKMGHCSRFFWLIIFESTPDIRLDDEDDIGAAFPEVSFIFLSFSANCVRTDEKFWIKVSG